MQFFFFLRFMNTGRCCSSPSPPTTPVWHCPLKSKWQHFANNFKKFFLLHLHSVYIDHVLETALNFSFSWSASSPSWWSIPCSSWRWCRSSSSRISSRPCRAQWCTGKENKNRLCSMTCLSQLASYRHSPPHVDPRDEAGDGELPVVSLPLRVPPPDEAARVPRAEVAGERGAMVWLHADHVQVGLHQRGGHHHGGLSMHAGSVRGWGSKE